MYFAREFNYVLFADLVLVFALFARVEGVGEFVFGFPHNGGRVLWGPGTKLPEAIEPEIREANMTVLLAWIKMADKVRESFYRMKERAGKCNGMYQINEPDYDNLQTVNEILRNPPPEMIVKIDEAIEKMNIYERRLLEELRKPEKDWNYSVESSTTPD